MSGERPGCSQPVNVEPVVLPPTFRVDDSSGRRAPAGETTYILYRPPHTDGYRCYVESWGFNAPLLDPLIVGLYVPTFLHVALVPRETDKDPTSTTFAGAGLNRQILANTITGFESFNADAGKGIKIPTDDNGRPWWVFVQIGHPLLLPFVESAFNISFAADRARWEF